MFLEDLLVILFLGLQLWFEVSNFVMNAIAQWDGTRKDTTKKFLLSYGKSICVRQHWTPCTMLVFIWNYLNLSEHIHTYPNLSELIRSYPSLSEPIKTYPNLSKPICPNLNLPENFQTLNSRNHNWKWLVDFG